MKLQQMVQLNKTRKELLEKFRKLIEDYDKVSMLEGIVRDDLARIDTPGIYQEKCDLVYQHVFDSYSGEGKSVYGRQDSHPAWIRGATVGGAVFSCCIGR